VFTSLQQGLLDAQENPIPIVSTFKLYEVQKFLSLTGHVYSPAPILMSKKTWDRMPADLQRVMADTALEVAKVQRQLNRTQEQKQLGELRAKGMTVLETPDRTAFREAMKPVFEQFQGQFGKDLVQRIATRNRQPPLGAPPLLARLSRERKLFGRRGHGLPAGGSPFSSASKSRVLPLRLFIF
jgi:TRAP-type C4-dicarboxylate transport system substrate-binding protein